MQARGGALGLQDNPICLNDDDLDPQEERHSYNSVLGYPHRRTRDPFNYFDHSPGSSQGPEIIDIVDDDEPPPKTFLSTVRNRHERSRFNPSTEIARPSSPLFVWTAPEGSRLRPPEWNELARNPDRRIAAGGACSTYEAPLQVEAPNVPLQVEAPKREMLFVLPQVETPMVPPQVEAPMVPPQVEAPVVPLQVKAPMVPLQLEAPMVPLQLEALMVPQQVEAPIAPLQMDAALMCVQALEAMEATEDFVDWKVRRADAAQFGDNYRHPLRLVDVGEGEDTVSQEVKPGVEAEACSPLPHCPATFGEVNCTRSIKLVTRRKIRKPKLREQPERQNVLKLVPAIPDDSESSDVDNEPENEVLLLAERKRQEEEAELWRAADLALQLSMPAVAEVTEKALGCVHSFVRNPENGQSCEVCGIVKPAMSVEFAAPMRAAYRRAKRIDDEMDCIDEESTLTQLTEMQLEELGTPVEILKMKLPPTLSEKLKDHQKEAFKFAVKCLNGRGGCIFAHAPGTGKTFTIICFVKALLTYYPDKKVLIVAPKIMLEPWKEEFNRWKIKDIKTYNLFDKTEVDQEEPEKRRAILQMWKDNKSVLLASYRIVSGSILSSDGETVVGKELVETPDVVVLDEGHCLRNSKAKVLQALRKVRTKNRVLLSGTLFQNNFEEFYHLLKFVKGDFLMSDPDFVECRKVRAGMSGQVSQKELEKKERKHFIQKFNDILCEKEDPSARFSALQSMQKLQSLLPFVDYHEGADLKATIEIQEYVLMMQLLSAQAVLVGAQADLTRQLSHAPERCRLKDFQHTLQASIHPAVIRSDQARPDPMSDQGRLDPKQGVKTNFIFEMLALCHSVKEKLVVFSQYTGALDLIQKMLETSKCWNLGTEILRIDGKGAGVGRFETTRQFNEPSSCSKIILCSIKACGEGISLIGASRMIMLDASWNPSVTCQAISRAFRMGQTRTVYVYHLIASDTVEATIRQRAIRKEWVSKNLFRSKESKDEEVPVKPNKCRDLFLQSTPLTKDVKQIIEVVRR